MRYRLLAVALLAGACGTVTEKPADAGVSDGAAPDGAPGAVTWRNQPGDVPAVTFGGTSSATGTIYCKYTITLKQLDLQLSILPSGQVTSGHVQDLNVEAVVPSMPPTTPFVCSATNPGAIPANIAMYQLATTTAGTGGLTLTFQTGSSNMPPAALVINLTKVSSLYSAKLTFHRNDGLDPVFEWTVATTVPLAPQ
ncbi:MAG TPA: hypothetical protein VHT91_20005 [Kofleriaceae bacterium]|jgi:hypothetical protein|nr:hypothetical protein [Kofleriaceae bacterium]